MIITTPHLSRPDRAYVTICREGVVLYPRRHDDGLETDSRHIDAYERSGQLTSLLSN